jgi:hypothetical protein
MTKSFCGREKTKSYFGKKAILVDRCYLQIEKKTSEELPTQKDEIELTFLKAFL